MTNAQFWSLGFSLPLTISVSLGGVEMLLHVEINPPTILRVATFENFEACLFPGVPNHIRVDTLFASHAVVDWYADEDLVCQDSPIYTPTLEDINKKLRVLITPSRDDHDGLGCEEAYEFKEKVAVARPNNTVLDVRPDWQFPRTSNHLRVLSYNILADQNAFSGENRQPFFPWVSEDVLKRNYRFPLILHEILAYQADVVCLQEVDQLVYDTLLEPVMGHYNYQGFYSVKQTSGNQEGCALFWSLSKFQQCHENEYRTFRISELLQRYVEPLDDDDEWNPFADVITDIFRKRPDLLDTVKNKLGHVLQIASLKGLDGSPLLISNSHLFFHPKAPHIRLMQLFAIAHQLDKEHRSMDDAPFIFCGDLNTSLTNCVILYMDRCVPKNYRDYRECFNGFTWQARGGTSFDEESGYDFDFPEFRLPKSFPDIATAYPEYPVFTHYIVGFHAALDHILMTPNTPNGKLRFIRQATMPTEEQVTRDTAMPGPTFPSDHIAVVSDLDWIIR